MIKKFDEFNETLASDIDFFKDEIKSIYKTENDEAIRNLFNDIKSTFDEKNLYEDKNYYIAYNIDGVVLKVRDESWLTPGYGLKIDDKETECSFLLKRKIYNFLHKKWRVKEKQEKREKAERLKRDLSGVGRNSKKYNI